MQRLRSEFLQRKKESKMIVKDSRLFTCKLLIFQFLLCFKKGYKSDLWFNFKKHYLVDLYP
jgi:hypothetical protein